MNVTMESARSTRTSGEKRKTRDMSHNDENCHSNLMLRSDQSSVEDLKTTSKRQAGTRSDHGGGSSELSSSAKSAAKKRTAATDGMQSDSDDEDSDTAAKSTTSEAGQILIVYVENFMCHHKMTVDFGRNVNFVTGQNGSGAFSTLCYSSAFYDYV